MVLIWCNTTSLLYQAAEITTVFACISTASCSGGHWIAGSMSGTWPREGDWCDYYQAPAGSPCPGAQCCPTLRQGQSLHGGHWGRGQAFAGEQGGWLLPCWVGSVLFSSCELSFYNFSYQPNKLSYLASSNFIIWCTICPQLLHCRFSSGSVQLVFLYLWYTHNSGRARGGLGSISAGWQGDLLTGSVLDSLIIIMFVSIDCNAGRR